MRGFILVLGLFSVLVLSGCGSLKDDVFSKRPVSISKAGEVTNQNAPMFTLKEDSKENLVTSKPMFTVKRERKKLFGKESWFKKVYDSVPVGYNASPKGTVIKPPQAEEEYKEYIPEQDKSQVVDRYTFDHTDETSVEDKLYEPVEYPDVNVYPVDGDRSPYEDSLEVAQSVEEVKYVNHSSDIAGEVSKQIFFEYGSAKINPAQMEKIKNLSYEIVSSGNAYEVSVVGHASKRVDKVKSKKLKQKINQRMSEVRAQTVSGVLAEIGIPSQLVVISAVGADVPNPTPGTLPQEVADRRVDIYIAKKKGL